MAETTSQLKQEYTPSTKAKLHLLNTGDMDGRTKAVKLVKEFETQMALDMAGDLTEAQRALARRAAVLNAVLSDCDTLWARDGTLDVSMYVTATNSLRRVLVTLGVHRISKPAGVVELMQHD